MNSKYIAYQRDPVAYKACSNCNLWIRYYRFDGTSMAPHFYCDSCSNIFFSSEHRKKIWGKRLTDQLLLEIEETLPLCSCGGQFKPSQNPKCPHCHHEIKHDDSPLQRLTDPYAILVDGASVISDEQPKRAFHLSSNKLVSKEWQDKIHLIILSTNLIDVLPPSNEIEICIKGQVPTGASLVQAHHLWGEAYFPKLRTPKALARQPEQETCPPNICHLEIECVEKRNPGMGSFFGFTGYYLSVLVSLDSEKIWDARGESVT